MAAERTGILAYTETHKLVDEKYMLPRRISQQEWGLITLEAGPIEAQPLIFVRKGDLEPQPLIVTYYHFDSDDDDFAVEGFDITRITGFFIDPESNEPDYILSIKNDGSVPHVGPDLTFYQSVNGSGLTPITILDQKERCRSINLDFKG